MDILYLSDKAAQELTQYCESKLLKLVIEHFAINGKIIHKKDDEQPSRWWIITDYIINETINSRDKLAVILSLANIGGIIQISDKQASGYVDVLNMLIKSFYISDNDYEYFKKAYLDLKQGKEFKFSLHEI